MLYSIQALRILLYKQIEQRLYSPYLTRQMLIGYCIQLQGKRSIAFMYSPFCIVTVTQSESEVMSHATLLIYRCSCGPSTFRPCVAKMSSMMSLQNWITSVVIKPHRGDLPGQSVSWKEQNGLTLSIGNIFQTWIEVC